MQKTRKQLTYNERKAIEQLLIEKKSCRKIGKILGRNHTDISREIKRNKGEHLPYSADRAQIFTEKKLLGKRKTKIEQNIELKKYVIQKIRENWSPEQISGKLKKKKKPPGQISHEAIYNYI